MTGFPGTALRDGDRGGDRRRTALIAVTPIFTASYSGLFKSFFDVIDNGALTGKPVLIAATGGTARHSLVLEHAHAPALRLPARDRRTDRGLRRVRGLGRRREGPAPTASRTASPARPASWPG